MLAEAKKLAAARGLVNFRTARARAEDLPFPDMSFDLVACRLAAHHFENVAAFVAEALRVLMPGGIFGLVDNISPDERNLAAAYNDFEKLRDPSTVAVSALPSGRRCSATWDSPSTTASTWTRT
jgi:ubiquinone/menaquinone biosynthesis C-methylase UbiE